MRKSHRYSIKIKDAKGSIVFAIAAIWDGDDRRVAVAKMLRLHGILEAPSVPNRSGEDVATNIDVERMATPFVITTPPKKKPRH
jgi:hypothetical protein